MAALLVFLPQVALLLYYLCQVMAALLVFLPQVALLLYYLCQATAALLVFLPQVALHLDYMCQVMAALLVFLPHCGAASLLPVPGDGSAPGVPSSGCPQSESSFHAGWPAAAPCRTAQVKQVSLLYSTMSLQGFLQLYDQ
jgi:hypothetical protein